MPPSSLYICIWKNFYKIIKFPKKKEWIKGKEKKNPRSCISFPQLFKIHKRTEPKHQRKYSKLYLKSKIKSSRTYKQTNKKHAFTFHNKRKLFRYLWEITFFMSLSSKTTGLAPNFSYFPLENPLIQSLDKHVYDIARWFILCRGTSFNLHLNSLSELDYNSMKRWESVFQIILIALWFLAAL